jgi:hypothetical protein
MIRNILDVVVDGCLYWLVKVHLLCSVFRIVPWQSADAILSRDKSRRNRTTWLCYYIVSGSASSQINNDLNDTGRRSSRKCMRIPHCDIARHINIHCKTACSWTYKTRWTNHYLLHLDESFGSRIWFSPTSSCSSLNLEICRLVGELELLSSWVCGELIAQFVPVLQSLAFACVWVFAYLASAKFIATRYQ